jgi:hypothetical protein
MHIDLFEHAPAPIHVNYFNVQKNNDNDIKFFMFISYIDPSTQQLTTDNQTYTFTYQNSKFTYKVEDTLNGGTPSIAEINDLAIIKVAKKTYSGATHIYVNMTNADDPPPQFS